MEIRVAFVERRVDPSWSTAMDTLAAIYAIIHSMSGTPYISGGNSAAGTDCSGLASIVANIASGREAFSGRFTTADEAGALASRGFAPGTAPDSIVIGWNGRHTAVTLPDGTSVASGEGGGVRFGGGGAYQDQFTNHMYLPVRKTHTATLIQPASEDLHPENETIPTELPPPGAEMPAPPDETPVEAPPAPDMSPDGLPAVTGAGLKRVEQLAAVESSK